MSKEAGFESRLYSISFGLKELGFALVVCYGFTCGQFLMESCQSDLKVTQSNLFPKEETPLYSETSKQPAAFSTPRDG